MPDALVACTLFVYWRYMLIEAVNLRIILRSLPAWGVRVEIAFITRAEYKTANVTPRMGSAG